MHTFRRNALHAALLLSGYALAMPNLAFGQDAIPAPGTGAQASTNDPSAPAQGVQKDAVDLQGLVVTGNIGYRSHIDVPAPVLVYDQQFFAKFEPVSVGDQLRRVPGVAFVGDVGESVAPEMRGLGNGYTQILVNGRAVPGIGNDRSVAVDRIPAEIIDRIEIIRSPSADFDSQGVGGTINIILKDGATLPPGVIVRVGETWDKKTGRIRPNASVSWSGRNDSNTVFYSLTLDAQKRFNEKHAIQEVVDGNTVGFDGVVAAGGNGRSLQNWDDISRSRAVSREEQGDVRESKDLSFNGDVTWRMSDVSSLRLDAFAIKTRRTEHESTQTYEGDGSVGGLDLANPELKFETTPIDEDSYGLSALFNTSFNDQTDFEAYLGRNSTKGSETKHYFKDTPDTKDKIKGTEADDKNWQADASITRHMPDFAKSLGIDGATLKVGVQLKNKDRSFTSSEVSGLSKTKQKGTDGTFEYKEDRFDTYAKVDWDLTPMVTVTTGVRGEKTRSEQDYVTTDYVNGAQVDQSVGHADSHEFMLNPSAHLQWRLTDADQLRFSVARTVRRPSVDQLVPSVTLESPGDYDVTMGNPDLKMERSLGFDLGYEHSIGKSGVVGVNVFQRNISDLIGMVRTTRPVTDAGQDPADFPGGLYSFQNIGSAKVRGVEFDLSMPLTFLGMDHTGVFGNYTRLFSKRLSPITGRDVTVDDQPSFVYNVGVTQDIPAWKASFGASYQKQGPSYQHNSPGEMQSTSYGGNLEVFLEKRLGKSFVLRLTGNNLLDSCSEQLEQDFAGDDATEMMANNRAYNVDFMELERECSSPRWSLTLRAVF
jgi:outer membrane receptor protein involved in Fe transport